MKKIIKVLQLCIILPVLSILLCYGVAYSLGDPLIEQTRYIKMVDQQGDVFYQSSNQGSYTPIDQISPYFLDAIISIEDHRFYDHFGLDFIGIARAAFINLKEQSTSQGASTISQQYARLLYLTNDKTWSRKIKEAFLTMQIETHLDKEKILEGYVNALYFGHGMYGIQDASMYYYGVDASELSLDQASMLAGVINGPAYFSPFIDEQAAKDRQAVVLEAMVQQEQITVDDKQDVIDKEVVLVSSPPATLNTQNYYFKDTVLEELERLGFLKDQYTNRGLTIQTTLSMDYQTELIETTTSNMDDKEYQSATIVVEPYTSKVLALLGGNNYASSQFNRATQSSRHIGSTIKPFLYYLAIENGFTPITSFLVEPTTFKLADGSIYEPSNFNHLYANKEVTLAQALAVSDNIFAVKTHLFLGEQTLASFLEQFGYEDVDATASLALGTLDTNVYGLATMYNTLASEGLYQPLYVIESIQDHFGNTLYEHTDSSTQLLKKDNCLILSQLLTGTFDSQFNTYLNATLTGRGLSNTNAGKTGSTLVDSLAVGYNPDVLVVSWVGYDDNREMPDANQRVSSKNIMLDMLQYVSSNEDTSWYKPTESIEVRLINPVTGKQDPNGTPYWFKKETSQY